MEALAVADRLARECDKRQDFDLGALRKDGSIGRGRDRRRNSRIGWEKEMGREKGNGKGKDKEEDKERKRPTSVGAVMDRMGGIGGEAGSSWSGRYGIDGVKEAGAEGLGSEERVRGGTARAWFGMDSGNVRGWGA
jgi:hypothetical protein